MMQREFELSPLSVPKHDVYAMIPYPEIDPVLFSVGPIFGLGPLKVHWYGIMYLLGFVAAWRLALYHASKPWTAIKQPQVENLIVYGAWGVILGGRIGYVLFYDFARWLSDPALIVRVWEGGMSFHGGLIGVCIAMSFYARFHHKKFLEIADFAAPLVPLGLFFGRLGNFIGQELWGRATDLPWAMVFPADDKQLARHPSQLYEALLEGLVLFVILHLFTRKPRRPGEVGGLFLLGYGCFRFSVEFVREPDQHILFDLFGWMTRGQILCLPMILLGLYLLRGFALRKHSEATT